MEKLNLTKVEAWAINSSDNERSSSIKGYYKDSNIASVNAKGSGYYGSDGDVVKVEIYEDEEGNIYTLKSLGKYKDVDRKYREEAMNKIKDKLTPEELKLLGL